MSPARRNHSSPTSNYKNSVQFYFCPKHVTHDYLVMSWQLLPTIAYEAATLPKSIAPPSCFTVWWSKLALKVLWSQAPREMNWAALHSLHYKHPLQPLTCPYIVRDRIKRQNCCFHVVSVCVKMYLDCRVKTSLGMSHRVKACLSSTCCLPWGQNLQTSAKNSTYRKWTWYDAIKW